MKRVRELYSYVQKSAASRLNIFSVLIINILIIVFSSGCTKEDLNKSRDIEAPTVISVTPADKSTIAVSVIPEATFSEAIDSSTVTLAFFVMEGNNKIPGKVSYSGRKATFIPSNPFDPATEYSCIITTSIKDTSGNAMASDFTWTFSTGLREDITPPEVVTAIPALNANSVSTGIRPSVIFSEEMDILTIIKPSFILKRGEDVIPGAVTYSDKTATFTPSSALQKGTLYSATIKTFAKDIAGNALASDYTWTFRTESDVDNTPPAVLSVTPGSNATGIATSTILSVTFSELMNQTTINTSSLLLKHGSTSVAGTISYSGNSATFTPSSDLLPGIVYNCTITTAVKDAAGNPLSSNYTWTFTTTSVPDATPPTVLSVVPAANATSVAINVKPSVTFSESMNSSTVSSASLSVKQGTSTISGSITWSGNTAVFTPSTALLPGMVYNCTVTTAVKDAAGNSLASNFSWSFTTASAAGKSFSADVVPVLNLCNTCHTHNWTPSANPSTFHANLVSSGYINLTTPTSGKIFKKLDGGHPPSTVSAAQKTTVMTWILEGSKNN